MPLATACTVVACVLAIGAGIAKLARPRGAVAAMRAVGLPSGAWAVRVGAALECAVGTAALVSSSAVARLALALTYAAFAAFVVASLRAGSTSGCGCFGVAGPPIGTRHLVVDVALAAAVAAGALGARGSVVASLHASTLAGGLALALGVVGAGLAATVLTRARTG